MPTLLSLTARLFDREMYGLEVLAELAEDVFEDAEPLAMLFRGAAHDIVKNGGGYDVIFNLPLADKEDVYPFPGSEIRKKVPVLVPCNEDGQPEQPYVMTRYVIGFAKEKGSSSS